MIPNLRPLSTLSLIPAAPGWTITLYEGSKDDPNPATLDVCPILAWAVVLVDGHQGRGQTTAIEPVFLLSGLPHTPIDGDLDSDEYAINAPQDAS